MIFLAFGIASVVLRGLPVSPIEDVGTRVVATIAGIAIGTILSCNVSPRIARAAMLAVAWAGATVVLVRGILAVFV